MNLTPEVRYEVVEGNSPLTGRNNAMPSTAASSTACGKPGSNWSATTPSAWAS